MAHRSLLGKDRKSLVFHPSHCCSIVKEALNGYRQTVNYAKESWDAAPASRTTTNLKTRGTDRGSLDGFDHEDSVFNKELEKIDRFKKMTKFEVSTWLKNEGKRLKMMDEIKQKEKAWGFRVENNQRVFDHKRSDLRAKFDERMQAAKDKEAEILREKRFEERVLSQKMKQFAENAERERRERKKKMEEQEQREAEKRKIAEQKREQKYYQELESARELLEDLEKKSRTAQEKHTMSVSERMNRMKMRCDKVTETYEDYKRTEEVRKAHVIQKISNKMAEVELRQERSWNVADGV